jgi:hypothetical protein
MPTGKCSCRSPTEWVEPRRSPCIKYDAEMRLPPRIAPTEPGFDIRTFECSICANVDRYTTKYQTSEPWTLVA